MNDQLLKDLSVRGSKDVPHNLVSSDPTGAYLAGHDIHDRLMDWYSDNVENGVFMSLMEKSQEYSQVRVDIDIKQEGTEPRKLYTDQHLATIIEAFQQILRRQVLDCHEEDLTVFVLEKPPYIKEDGAKTYIKNGFHLQFPRLFLSCREVYRNIYPKVGELLDRTEVDFSDLVQTNPSELLDAHAGCFNHWLMYGSGKNRKTGRYMLSKILTVNKTTISLEDFIENYHLFNASDSVIETADKPAEWWLPRILSINTCGRPTKEITNSILEVIDAEQQSALAYSGDSDDEDVDQDTIESELDDAEHLLTLLCESRADDHTDWWKICQVLKKISHRNARGFEIFCEFTQQSPRRWAKHGQPGCMDLWNGKQYGFGMGTLKYLAKTDNPEGYQEFLQLKSIERLQQSATATHNDFARTLKDLAGDNFVFSNGKWWQYTGQQWKPIEFGMPLKKMISKELRDHFSESLRGIQAAANDVDATKAAEAEWKEKRQYINKLKDNNYKRAIMAEASEVFWRDDFESTLDKNGKLFVFTNGVMDYNMIGDDGFPGVFRSLTPDDLTTKMANVPYVEYDDDSPEMQRLMEYLNQVFPDPELREFFLELYSDIMIAGNTYKIVPFWVGVGNNSKSVLQGILEKALYKYFCKVPTSLFVGKRGQSGSANPELARLEGVRMAMGQETSSKEEMNSGIFKELSGNDTMFCRGLYSEGKEIAMEAVIGISCNNPPMLQGDRAAWNRVKVIDFEAEFVHNAPPTREEQFATKKFPMDVNFMDVADQLCGPLLYVLAKYKRRMMRGFLKIPERVNRATQEYKKRNDIFSNYLEAFLVLDPQGTLDVTAEYREFRLWFREIYSNSTAPNLSEFKAGLCGILRKQVPGGNTLQGIRQKSAMDTPETEPGVFTGDSRDDSAMDLLE